MTLCALNNNVQLGPNVSVSPNCRIGPGVRLKNCIVLDGTEIKVSVERQPRCGVGMGGWYLVKHTVIESVHPDTGAVQGSQKPAVVLWHWPGIPVTSRRPLAL